MGRLYDDEDYETDSLLKEISNSLGKQISDELDKDDDTISYSRNTARGNEPVRSSTTTTYGSSERAYSSERVYSAKMEEEKKWNTKRILKIVGVTVAVLVLAVVLLGNYILDQLNYEPDSDRIVDEEGNEIIVEDIVPSDKEIINILLIGEEAMADDRGRSDVMMVLTINQKYDRLVLTSFLRDSYVVPPGYSSGTKMNEVYKKGGGPLLVSTIEEHFQIQIDGYARVNFQSFEDIIDLLGGVEIELTAAEADYLNRTNYISDPSNRNVAAGVQTLNGNQALGYSRVRYVEGINGERDDFGRTNRQRAVINAIFDKYKSKGLVELITVTNKILPHITTNMTKSDILSYLTVAAGMLGSSELETFRVPMNDAYTNAKINGKAVLQVDFPKVQAALQDEMYGTGYLTEEEKKALEEAEQSSEGTTAAE